MFVKSPLTHPFPKGGIMMEAKHLSSYELIKTEKNEPVENFHRFERLKHSTVNPKAFTEKGLYMLATILKSTVATQATLTIIETFIKLRELSINDETKR